MKRLTKSDRAVVDPVVERVFDLILPSLHSIEGFIVRELLPNVPPRLAMHAFRELLNRAGAELWGEAELAVLTHGES